MIRSATAQEEGGASLTERERLSLCRRLLKRSKQTESGCREWTGSGINTGYGHIKVRGKTLLVHRVAYAEFVAPIPEGLHVLHKCDNRRCIRPSHLFVGTQSDNMKDCSAKGRLKIVFGRNKGEINGGAKLKDVQVAEIRELLKHGASQADVAARFGICRAYVSRIKVGAVRK